MNNVFLSLVTGLTLFSACKQREFGNDTDVKNVTTGVSDPNCVSEIQIPADGPGAGPGSYMTFERAKIPNKMWTGKDISGEECEVRTNSSAVARDGYQTVSFSAKFANFGVPSEFRNIADSDLGIDDNGDIKNASVVEAKMKQLGYNPQLFMKERSLMTFSGFFGPIPPSPVSPVGKVVKLGFSKKSCEPVFVMVVSNYPFEKKADLCTIGR